MERTMKIMVTVDIEMEIAVDGHLGGLATAEEYAGVTASSLHNDVEDFLWDARGSYGVVASAIPKAVLVDWDYKLL